MSGPFRPARPIEVRSAAECMCHDGGRCTSYDPGHALHLIQDRLATATPAEWVDAIVTSVDPVSGTVTARTLAAGAPVTYANAAGAADAVAAGDPIAVHSRYRVLVAGSRRYNVREVG